MASRIMHLAISKQLEKSIELKDIDRFRIGQILPDAVIPNQEVPFNSHYRKSVDITPVQPSMNNFKEELINQICPFDLESFLVEMQSDFSEHIKEKPKHFTEEFADRYIEQCRVYCLKEYNALLDGKP